MSQLTGRRLPGIDNTGYPAAQDYHPASVYPADAEGNGALAAMILPLPLTMLVDSITTPTVTYVGYCAPELAAPDGGGIYQAAWAITRITDDGTGCPVIEHAYTPAAAPAPARYAQPEHRWDERAALDYA